MLLAAVGTALEATTATAAAEGLGWLLAQFSPLLFLATPARCGSSGQETINISAAGGRQALFRIGGLQTAGLHRRC